MAIAGPSLKKVQLEDTLPCNSWWLIRIPSGRKKTLKRKGTLPSFNALTAANRHVHSGEIPTVHFAFADRTHREATRSPSFAGSVAILAAFACSSRSFVLI